MIFKFGRGKPVIDPFELKRDKILCGKRIILTFHPPLFMKVRKMLVNARSVKLSGWLFKSFMGTYCGEEIVVCLPFPCSPAAIVALEVLTAMGGKVFVVIRRVRAINPALGIGDVLIPIWGLREEGASFHYIPDIDYIPRPDVELAEILYKHAVELKRRRRIKVVKGGV